MHSELSTQQQQRRRVLGQLLPALLALPAAPATLAQSPGQAPRIALVVGINDYLHHNDLTQAIPDAELVDRTLRQFGFEVTLLTDRNPGAGINEPPQHWRHCAAGHRRQQRREALPKRTLCRRLGRVRTRKSATGRH